jgi:hypothetical protein
MAPKWMPPKAKNSLESGSKSARAAPCSQHKEAAKSAHGFGGLKFLYLRQN